VCECHWLYWKEHVRQPVIRTRWSRCQHVSLLQKHSPKWDFVFFIPL